MTRWTVHLLWAGLLVSIVALSRAETSTSSTSADDEKAKPEFPAQMKIGVVDIKHVLTKCKSFNEKMAALREKIEKAEAKIKGQQGELKKLADEANAEAMPTDERAQLAKKAEQRLSLMNAEIAIQKQEFQKEETTVYADSAVALDRHIAECAKKHGLHIVLRINADAPNLKERQEIVMGLNKQVCYFDPNLDITPEIIKAMNED